MHKTTRRYRCSYDDLQDLINHADGVIEQNLDMKYSDFHLETNTEWDSPYAELRYETPETPQETKIREKREKEQKERTDKWNRDQFERLKKLGYK